MSLPEHEFTDRAALHAIAKKRGVKDPQNCRVICGGCSMEPSQIFQGIMHMPDCDAGLNDILFLKLGEDGSWRDAGKGRLAAALDTTARFFGLAED